MYSSLNSPGTKKRHAEDKWSSQKIITNGKAVSFSRFHRFVVFWKCLNYMLNICWKSCSSLESYTNNWKTKLLYVLVTHIKHQSRCYTTTFLFSFNGLPMNSNVHILFFVGLQERNKGLFRKSLITETIYKYKDICLLNIVKLMSHK